MAFQVLAFLFGLVWGSFLNVVALRYNTGKSIGGRSFCFSCGKTLQWYELIPVFSFVFLKGKCSRCKTHISFQYPFVELITGFLFFILAAPLLESPSLMTWTLFFITVGIFSCLTVITVYDFKHKIIPDGPVFAFIFLALLTVVSTHSFEFNLQSFAAHFGAGPGVALPLFILWFASNGRWLGFGDVKLALGIGWFLGPIFGLSALIVSFWIGAIYGLGLMAFQRLPYIRVKILELHNRLTCKRSERNEKVFEDYSLISERSAASKEHSWGLPNDKMLLTMKSEVPFGPFLVLSTTLIYFVPVDVLGLSRIFDVL